MTGLLCHPHLITGEGPQGYLLRLANANGLNIATIKILGVHFGVRLLQSLRCLPDQPPANPLIAYATGIERHLETNPQSWNVRRCRCCPSCLRENAHWRMGWEQLFFDVCPVHGCWLIDQCDACGSAITWRRQELLQCDCGHHFAHSYAHEAPLASKALAMDLQSKLLDSNTDCQLLALQGLNSEQATRLVRLLGTYGQSQIGRLPQKVPNVGTMGVSWQITSTAAEILNLWPQSFQQMLHGMLERTVDSSGQRIPSRFGFFYSLLYKRFSEVEFAHLHRAFESFIAEHWHGPIAKRNRRLSQAILSHTAWVPANHARRQLQISSTRLIDLIRSGALVGEERMSKTGRRFVVVQQDSIRAMRSTMEDELDLATVSEMLGFTRARLRSALSSIFPNARKIEGAADRWAISRAEVDRLLQICRAPLLVHLGEGEISLDHILRFWCCSEDEIAQMLVHIQSGALAPLGRLSRSGSGDGLSGLVFNEAEAQQLVSLGRPRDPGKWTIPQVADMLNVKQAVAYFMVRQGLLPSVTEVIGRKEAAMVTREGLEAFRARYVFARDLAKLCKTSSRSLQFRLAEINIHPIASPALGVCRQVIYERTPALKDLFRNLT